MNRLTFSTFPCLVQIQMLVLYWSQYESLTTKTEIQGTNCPCRYQTFSPLQLEALDSEHFHFGSKIQHFSIFGSNQNAHVLNQIRNSESGITHNTSVDLVFMKPINIPILSLLPAPMHNAGCMMYYHLPPYHLSLPLYHLSWSNIYENSQHTEV